MKEAQSGQGDDRLVGLCVNVRHDGQDPPHDVHQALVGRPQVKLRLLAVCEEGVEHLQLKVCKGLFV